MVNVTNNIQLLEQEIFTKFSFASIPDVENFTKELLLPLFDYIINNNSLSQEDYDFIKKNYPIFLDKIRNKDGSKRGLPDLVCFKGKEIMFIEVKNENDSLSFNQINWAKEHLDYKIKVLRWINKSINELKEEKIFELKRDSIFKEIELRKEIDKLKEEKEGDNIKIKRRVEKLEIENIKLKKIIKYDPTIGI